MDFYAVLDQVLALLQSRGRVTYRALKRQFTLDDDFLEDLKAEIIQAQRLAVDEAGEVLVWIGTPHLNLLRSLEQSPLTQEIYALSESV